MISEFMPEGFVPQLEVASCYIEHDGDILLLQRHSEHKHSSKWGLPAGKLEKGETAEQAIIREIEEETGLNIHRHQLTFRDVLYVSQPDKKYLYHSFHTKLAIRPTIRINPPEHKQHDWFTTSEALSMELIHDLDACIERHYGLAKVGV